VVGEVLDMAISQTIKQAFPKETLRHSDSGKKLIQFEKSDFADGLFNFLQIHPSTRVCFGALVKADFVSDEKVPDKLISLLKNSETSLLFEAKCKCGVSIEKPHVYDLLEMNFPRTLSCAKCKQKNFLEGADYNKCYQIDIKDFNKIFYKGHSSVFSISPIKECFFCGNLKIIEGSRKFNVVCPKCHNLAYISMQIFPFAELKNLVKEKQGYWFEWYVWRLLKKYSTAVGVLFNNKFEADIVVVNNKKKIFIECKDSTSEELSHLHEIKKKFDHYLLISTGNYKKACRDNAKEILGRKFQYISPDKIEKIEEIISKL
jgi:hypothetical protein